MAPAHTKHPKDSIRRCTFMPKTAEFESGRVLLRLYIFHLLGQADLGIVFLTTSP